MTRAEQVKMIYNNKKMTYSECLEEADKIADAYEQDYENEMTYFEYSDGSIAVFCGIDMSITTYGCKN